ncbi:MAG: allophanate hydrolase [Trebouxia sp. A1-2]|nr:MAG: allophanate hydrolase [Trebouxia sp. A1-2]
MPDSFTFFSLHSSYNSGSLTPSNLINELYPSINPRDGTFVVSLASLEDLLSRCRELEAVHAADRPPLWGIPFAVKDNIDVAGFKTTAACKDFTYEPEDSAPAVQALLNAGAIFVGKTNMDQFAAGLVGTRTPYGTAPNAFDARFIPGGSSSGSGAAVGAGLVSFALGTDTAGSGRIPAGFNGCVGLKATVGRVSTTGVVPACASLDCLTCFATNVRDAATVMQVMQEAGSLEDPNWRVPDQYTMDQQYVGGGFAFAIPNAEFLDFSGPGGPALEAKLKVMFQEAVTSLKAQGGQQVDIDFSPFAITAKLLYESAFVAERYSGIRAFLDKDKFHAEFFQDRKVSLCCRQSHHQLQRLLMIPGLRESLGLSCLEQGRLHMRQENVFLVQTKVRFSVTAVLLAQARARTQMAKVDLLLVPTALHHYTVQEIEAEEKNNDTARFSLESSAENEQMVSGRHATDGLDRQALSITWTRNAKLGRFTNFVNLLDMCAVSVPSAVYRHPQIGEGLMGQLCPSGDALICWTGCGMNSLPWKMVTVTVSCQEESARRQAHLEQTGNPQPELPFGVTMIAAAWRDDWLCEIASRFHAASGLGCGPTGHGVGLHQGKLANGHVDLEE